MLTLVPTARSFALEALDPFPIAIAVESPVVASTPDAPPTPEIFPPPIEIPG